MQFLVRFILLSLTALLPIATLLAQSEVIQYYDSEKTQPKERFSVLGGAPSVLQGPYTAYFIDSTVSINGYYTNNQASGYWQYFYENGHPKMQGILKENVNHGLWEYFYENGNLQMKGIVYDSLRHGSWAFYYESGRLKNEGTFENGAKVGEWRYYYEDGVLKAIETYQKDSIEYVEFYESGNTRLAGARVKGKNTGLWTSYYEDGTIRSEGSYIVGRRDGIWKFYHENGKLSSMGDFVEGSTVGKWTYYYQNGNISAEGVEKNGVKEGYWKLYHSSGDIKGEAIFNEGEGTYREFYEDGQLKVEGRVEQGLNQGKWSYYYPDGTLEGESIYKKGKGTHTGYYRDGATKMKGALENNERVGVWELFRPDGTLAGYYESIYEDNKPVFRSLRQAEKNTSDTVEADKPLNPDYLYRKKNSRYFKPRINELRSVIVGVNPLALLLHRLPLSVEYYMQERLGYELEVGIKRNPFFLLNRNIDLGIVYQRGGFIGLKQKFYHPDTPSGIFYYGHRLGFDYLFHQTNTETSGPVQYDSRTIANSQTINYSLLIGTRLMKDADMINSRLTKENQAGGLTIDLSAGVGVGYSFFQRSYQDNPQFDLMLEGVNQSRVTFPLYLGVAVGYAF